MTNVESELFWELSAELERDDPRVHEGTIMSGRCLRLWVLGPSAPPSPSDTAHESSPPPRVSSRPMQGEFLALVDYKGSGLVVKLTKARVQALIASGVGREFGPAGRVFSEWVAVPTPDRALWKALLEEARDLAAAGTGPSSAQRRTRSTAAPARRPRHPK